MTYEQELSYVARLQSLMRDIREETRLYNDSVERVFVRNKSKELYEMMDSTSLEEIRQENARRKAEGTIKSVSG